MITEAAKTVDVVCFHGSQECRQIHCCFTYCIHEGMRVANLNEIGFELITRKLLYCIACGWTGGMYVCNMYVCGM